MVVDQEIDLRRDGGMKSMTSRDLFHRSRMTKTDCHGKTMLRPSSNKWIDNGLIRWRWWCYVMLCYIWYRYSGCSGHYVTLSMEILHLCHSYRDHSRRKAWSKATCSRLHLRTWGYFQPRTMGIAKGVPYNKCDPNFRYSIPNAMQLAGKQ